MIRIEPMNAAKFEASLERGIRRHAADAISRGLWTNRAALEASRDEFTRLLPQGQETPNRHFVHVLESTTGRQVGEAWYLSEPKGGRTHCWIDCLWIEREQRRQGFATQVLLLLEQEAKAAGSDRIGLSVLTENSGAMALYANLGYGASRMHLTKLLPVSGAR